MRQRGRKAASAHEVQTPNPVVIARPDACYSLRDEEADVWRGIVDSMPASWFTPGSAPVLAAYCRATVAGRRLGQLVNEIEHGGGEYDLRQHLDLLRAQAQQAQSVKTLATSLRLTPQSRYTPHGAGTAAGRQRCGRKPWEW